MTREQVIEALQAQMPFEGSFYERNALDVYASGLTSPYPGYDSLDDALSDWKMEYDYNTGSAADEIIRSGEVPVWLRGRL